MPTYQGAFSFNLRNHLTTSASQTPITLEHAYDERNDVTQHALVSTGVFCLDNPVSKVSTA